MKRTMFYAMSFTWGLPLTLCGVVVALFLLATGHRPRRWGGCWYFNVGKSRWGGLNLGLVFLTDHNDSTHTKNHEFGHAIQNCYLGPIMLFFVLCSAIRYHYIDYLEKRGYPSLAMMIGGSKDRLLDWDTSTWMPHREKNK